MRFQSDHARLRRTKPGLNLDVAQVLAEDLAAGQVLDLAAVPPSMCAHVLVILRVPCESSL